MTPEQLARLNALQEKIAEVLLDEMNPDNWAGAGLTPAAMNKQQRGDRYFDKKNAAMTAMLYIDNGKLLLNSKAALGRDPYKDDELDKKIAAAEKTAGQLLDKVKKKASATNGKAKKS